MRIPRLYLNQPLRAGGNFILTEQDHHYLKSVLRLKPGAHLEVFNGDGSAFQACLMELGKKQAEIEVGALVPGHPESPLHIELGLCVSRSERMDYAVQKAVELGVTEITPLLSRRCVVRLTDAKQKQRLKHWQAIARHACEQCGRNRLPNINPILNVGRWVADVEHACRVILHPDSTAVLDQQDAPSGPIALLIGPEGGFDDEELALAEHHQFVGMRLGPRVLRTETAVVVGLAALQIRWGDLAS